MKTLIITGSPKKEGLCAELAEIAFEAAKKAGAEAEVLRVHDCRLQPCRMCGDGWGSCREKHVCAFGNDGLTELQAKLAEADNFVLLTPVYWGGLSEELKSFLDRIRRCEASKNFSKNPESKSVFAGKPVIMVASAGGSGNGTLTALEQMDLFVRHVGGKFYDYIPLTRWSFDYKKATLASAVTAMLTEEAGNFRA